MKKLLLFIIILSLASCMTVRECPSHDKKFFLRKAGQKIPLQKVSKP